MEHVLRPLPPVADERAARGHISTFEARHVTGTVWALASLGLHAPALYHAAARQLQRQIPRAADKALAAVAATYTQPIVRSSTPASDDVLRTMLRSLQRRVAGGSVVPSVLAAVIWSLANPTTGPAASGVGRGLSVPLSRGEAQTRHLDLDRDGPLRGSGEASSSDDESGALSGASNVSEVVAESTATCGELALRKAVSAVLDELAALPSNVRPRALLCLSTRFYCLSTRMRVDVPCERTDWQASMRMPMMDGARHRARWQHAAATPLSTLWDAVLSKLCACGAESAAFVELHDAGRAAARCASQQRRTLCGRLSASGGDHREGQAARS